MPQTPDRPSTDPRKPRRRGWRAFRSGNHDEVLARNLKVMDASAIALARDNALPIVVFSLHEEGAMTRVLTGQGRYTLVTDEG